MRVIRLHKNTMVIGIVVALIAASIAVVAVSNSVDASDAGVKYTTDDTRGIIEIYMDGIVTDGNYQVNVVNETIPSGFTSTAGVYEDHLIIGNENYLELSGEVRYTVMLVVPGEGTTDVVSGTFNAGVVTFDGDGADGIMESVRVGGTYTLPANGFEVPTGKEFGGWIVNGDGEPVAAGTTIEITGDMTIRAVFTETVGPGPDPEPEVLDSITVSGEFDDVYQVGDVLDLDGMVVTAHYTNGGEDKVLSEGDYTVTPANGSRLDSVIDHVTVSYTENGVTKTVDVKITVTKLPTYLVSKDCVNGTVSGPAEIVKGGSGNYIVTPDYGYKISAVSYTVGEGQSVTVNVEDVMRCSFEIQNVTGAVTITATFVSDATGTVTVTAGDHGSIGAGGATSALVTVYGHWSITVTIDPDNGYRVSGISHDGAENSVTYEDGVLTIAAGSTVSKIDIAFEQIPVSDDDEEYVPPVITVIPGDDDDSTTYIVAIAAGVVVAILAALILMQTRKS